MHGRERHPHAAQPAHPARRPGARPARLGALPDRGDRPLRRPHRRRLRLPPLAHLGPRADRGIPRDATGSLRLPARPDAADAQPGPHRDRDRRDLRAAARPGARLARPRLLRLGEPQRQGDLPALHGLVRRQPGAPLAASAGRGGHALRRRAWAAPTACWRWRATPSRTGDFRWAAELVNHARLRRRRTTPRRAALQADALEQLGFGAENGTWRNFYLAGATELRCGNFGTPAATAARRTCMRALSPEQIFDAIAIRVDGPQAWGLALSIGVDLADSGEQLPARPAQRRPGPPPGRRGRRRPHRPHQPRGACPGCWPARWAASRSKGTSRSWVSCWAFSRRRTRTSTSSRRRRRPERPT